MDNIKVAIRVRPMIVREWKLGCPSKWVIKENTMSPMVNGKIGTPYSFDRIFDQDKKTQDIFDEICKPVITGFVQGFHGTIFAYGQSSSGKTFTMSGSLGEPGIISLSVEEIFRQMQNTSDKEFLLRISYMEIYNERVSDLLSAEDKTIKIQEDMDRNIQLTGVCEELVMTRTDVNQYMKLGNDRKHMAETKQNDRSSRSHCIMRMILESRETRDEDAVMVSHLNFVDLAGSEKAHENSGERYKEGCAINKSLFMLGTVISKLSDGVGHQHIGYRDSKLTRILQNAIGGNSKTAIIATITPASLEESHSTLRFASRAKTIKNTPHVNETLSDAALLKNSRKEIHSLQQKINALESMDVLVQKEELQKKLEEKMEAERKQTETIEKLKQFIIKAGSDNDEEASYKKLKRRRETWCPGKAQESVQDAAGGKFARDLNGKGLKRDVEFTRPVIAKSFVTSRHEESNLTDIAEMSGLADISLPKNDSLFMEFPPTLPDFPQQKTKHVSFRSPDPDFKSPPFSDFNEFEQLCKDYKDLQDSYDDMVQRYDQKCQEANQDQSYIQNELNYVNQHVAELEKENKLGNTKQVEELQVAMKKIQNEKNDLTDEVVLLQHRLSIQTRKLEECQHELTDLRSYQIDKPKDSTADIQNMKSQYDEEITRLTSEKEKLKVEISDCKNINEELQHQHETSLEMYIMKVQELEEKLEENEEKFSKNIDRLSYLEEENKSIQCTLNETGIKLLEANDSKEEVLKELDKIKSEKEKEELSVTNSDGLDQLTSDLKDCRSLVNEKEQRISELEKEVMHLYSKLKEHCGVDGQRRSTADELSDVLKEHCEDLENRLKELEMQNNILKDKLQCGFTSFEGQRRSTAEELSDVLKEHCEDLENRFKEVEAENNELKKKLITNSSTNDGGVDLTCLKEQIISLQNENASVKSHSAMLEQKIVLLTDKLTIDNHSEMNRRSTADELSDVLKEHCTDLEVRLREHECKNEEMKQTISRYTSHLPENERAEINILETNKKELRIELAHFKDKNSLDQEKIKSLQRDLVSFGEKLRADSVSESNRRSVEVELTDVYKEHCQDLQTRMLQLQLENSELSAKIDQLKAANEKSEMQQKELEAKIKMLEKKNLELQNGMLSSTRTGSLAEEFPSVFIENNINQISTNHSRVHDLEVELENLRREPVEKSEYILANEESKNKELLLDDELQRLRLILSEKHKEESDKLHVKIHQLEDEVLNLNSLVNEKSETLSDNQNMNEEIRELDSNRDDLTDVCRQEDSDKYLQLQHSLESLQQEHEQCVEMRAVLEKLQRESDQKISIESQTDENVFVQKLDISKSEDNVQEDSNCTQLQSQITQLKIENQLQCQVEVLEEENRCLLEKNEGNVSKIRELECQIEVLEEESKGLLEKTEEKDDLAEKLEDSDKFQQLQCQVEVLEEENRCLLEKNEGNVSKIQELECQIEVLEEESKGLLEKTEEKDDLAEKLEDSDKFQQLQCQVEVLEEENGCLLEKNEGNVSKIRELECQIEVLEEESKGLLEKTEEKDDLAEKLEDSDKFQQLQCQVEVLEEENRCLLEKNEGNVSKIRELECQIEVLEEESKGLLEKTEEKDDLAEKLEDSDKFQQLQCQVEVLEEENGCLLEKNEGNVSKIQELECQIEVLEEESKGLLEKTEEKDDLAEKLEDSDKFQQLQCQVEVLEEENRCLLEKNEGNVSKIRELECQIEVLEEESKGLLEKTEEKDDLAEKLEDSDKFQQLQCQVEVLEEENRCLLEKNEGNVSKIRELECQIEVLEEESKGLLEKTEEKDDLAEKLEDSDKFQQLQCQVEVLEEENRCLLEKNEGNVSKIRELECQIEVLEEESKSLLEKAEENIDFKIQELECRVEVLMEENRCLLEKSHGFDTSMLQELNLRINDLEEKNKCLLEKLESNNIGMSKVHEEECETDLPEIDSECLSKKSKGNNEFEELVCKYKILEEENRCFLEKLENTDFSKIQDLECKIQDLQEDNKCLSEKLEASNSMKCQELECKIEENKYQMQKLQLENETLKKESENSVSKEELECKVEVLQEEAELSRKESESERNSLNEKLEESECKVEVLQEEIETLTKQIETAQLKLEESECKTMVLQEENETLSKQIEIAQLKLEESECKTMVLQEENETLCKKVDNLVDKTLFDEVECKVEVLQEENNALSKQIQDLEDNYKISKNQESRISELMSEIQEIRHYKVKLESELTESQSEVSKACTQKLHLKEKGSKIIDDLKDDLEIMKATEKVLKDDNDKLLHEITNLQQSYQKLAESEKEKCENLSNEVEILQKQLSESITPDVLKVKLGEIDEIFQNKIKEKQRVIDQLSSTLTKINGDMNQVEEQNTKSENDKREMEQKLRTTEKSMKDLQDKVEHLQKDNEVLENKLKDTESAKATVSMDESMSTKYKLENMDKAAKERIVKLVIENNKLKDTNKKNSDLIEWQKKTLQSLKEQLEKKDRQSDLYEQLKATEEKMKKAETEADQFYEKCCKEEAKVSDLQNDIEQKIKEIHQLKQELENMESTGHSMKENGESSALKKKFTQIYNELQDAKKKINTMEKEISDKNLDIYHLQHNLEKMEFQYKKKISAYEESIEMYHEHNAKLKNEIRRVGTDQNDTIVNMNPIKKESGISIGKASSAGGAIDHFDNILLQEENRKLIQKCVKFETKMKALQDELAKYHKDRKENLQLEKKVAELREEEKRLKNQISEHHSSRTPLENVNSTSLDSVKTEPRFKLPGTTSTKKNNDIEEQCNQQCAQQ